MSIQAFADNEINIRQVTGGDNLVLIIDQIGYDNDVVFSLNHNRNNIEIKQVGHNQEISWVSWWGSGYNWGGDLDGEDNTLKLYQNCTKSAGNCNKNDIGFHISGDDNKLWWAEGYIIDNRNDTTWTYDGNEGGGHTVNVDIHGNNNSIVGFQRNCSTGACSGHIARIYLYGDDNDVFAEQVNDGVKSLYLTILNDDNVVDIGQWGDAAHTATITIDGTYGTNLDLIQKGNGANTYSLTQYCVTSAGCTISITQD